MKATIALFGLLALLFFSSCAKKDGDGKVSPGADTPGETTDGEPLFSTTMDVLRENENYSKLLALIESHNLQETFESEGPITFFAPTNESFDLISERSMSAYEEDAASVRYLLDKLIVEKELSAKDLQELETLQTRAGTVVSVERANGYLWIEGKPIMQKDGKSKKGYVHGIEGIVGFN